MTLEGEYYANTFVSYVLTAECRNPHDIGRRILQRKPPKRPKHPIVAILMTLEGEYYNF